MSAPFADVRPDELDHLLHAMRMDGRLARLSDQQVENILFALRAAGHQSAASLAGARYRADGLITFHNADCLEEPRFREAYALARDTGSWVEHDLRWRTYVLCWAAAHACHLQGDFVECGVYRGFFSRAVVHYVGFERLGARRFHLVDTYSTFPEQNRADVAPEALKTYEECYEEVKGTFASVPNAVIVRGEVPEALDRVAARRVAYLSLDMNHAASELAAIEFFWDRLSPGAPVVLDDYANGDWSLPQKRSLDGFATDRGVSVLTLPTGQGLLLRP